MTKIAFIHPDLGIGGAERLIVDAAVGLQNTGNDIIIYTSHCDKSHCFEEVSSGDLAVTVYGDFLPTKILQRFHILCSILRQLYLVLRLIISGEVRKYDYFIVDQLSFCVPLLKIFSTASVLFYCHFPDQLLSQRTGFIKRIYRLPFDMVEEWSTALADRIVVNSKFTRLVVQGTFRRLDPGLPLEVIYPCVDISQDTVDEKDASDFARFVGAPYLVSINRFERKKNIALAVRAFKASSFEGKLVVAGGWDERVSENVEYLQELQALCDSYGLKHRVFHNTDALETSEGLDVLFFVSVKSSLKNVMISRAQMLLYTPLYEHFGIVPVESMLLETPVLATNNGGPLETVVHYTGKNADVATGYNEEPQPKFWSKVLSDFSTLSPETRKALGVNGKKRAVEYFSREKMSEEFLANLTALKSEGVLKKSVSFWKFELAVLVLVVGVLAF